MPVHPDGKSLPCFICNEVLPNISDTSINQPSGGTAFSTQGHYGSTIFDPMNNSFIEITICDDCFRSHLTENNVLRGRQYKKCEYDSAFSLPPTEVEDLPIEEEGEHE